MLVLSATDIRKLSDMNRFINEIERVFSLYADGKAVMPRKVYVDVPECNGDFRAMPARVEQTVGLKWVNCHPDNPGKYGLPTVMALFILSDYLTGSPLALLDGTVLTGLRTAAATAVATAHLARSNAGTAGIIGCGAQASPHIEALCSVTRLTSVRLFDENRKRAEALAAVIGSRAEVVSIQEAAGSDIVVTLTPSRTPIIRREWIRPGTHINAVGADGPGKQELDPDLLVGTRVYVDDVTQAVHSGEINVPTASGSFDPGGIAGTLADVVAGKVQGRQSDSEITIFDSTGLAIEDVAVAVLIYREALRAGVGTQLRF